MGKALLFVLFAAGPASSKPAVSITEIHYHPPGAGDEEFVEIHNAGDAPADLSGWRFTKGITFRFGAGAKLGPREYAVVCADEASFRRAFGEEPRLAGAYEGRLENRGELLRLEDARGETITDIRYGDRPPWPREADGAGFSLSRVSAGRDTDDPAGWQAARPTPGAPSPRDLRAPPLSVYRRRHQPEAPRPGEPVEVRAFVYDEGGGADVSLEYRVIDGRRGIEDGGGRVAMRDISKEAGGDALPRGVRLFEGAIPPQETHALVRYTITAEGPGGASARCPPPDAPSPHGAFYVAPAVETELPLYSLIVVHRDHLASLDSRSAAFRPVAFVAGGEVYDPARLRIRGAWSRSWRKKSWKLVLPADRSYRGRRRLNLNSSWRDPAYIREALAYEIYERAGSLSLEARMVRVHLNGEFFGLFTEVEQPREECLERWGLRGAALYKAVSRRLQADERDLGSAAAYAGEYERETCKEEPFDELWRFCRELEASGEEGGGAPRAFFERRMDVPRLVDYIAATAITQNWDGFNKNHFIAHDREGSGKWYLVPWDLDRTFGDHWDRSFDDHRLPIHLGSRGAPGATGWSRIFDRFFADEEMKKLLYRRISDLLEEEFTEEKLLARVDELEARIASEADLDLAKWGGKESWREGVDGVRRFLVARRAFLLSELPWNLPRAPRNVRPEEAARLERAEVVLETSAFAHPDPDISHQATRWQVRRAEGSYSSPVVDRVDAESLTRLEIERGKILPRDRYCWRAAHLDSRGKLSPFSEETSFVAGDFELRIVRFDLSRHFDRDVVANPGDLENDPFDVRGGVLIVDGFDGVRADNPVAGGVPVDRRVGIHRLGDYTGANVVQRDFRSPWKLRIEAPRRVYSHLRMLVSGGNGDSRVPVVFEYASGRRQREVLPCDDWYDDPPPEGPEGELQAGLVPVLNGMDRIRGSFKDRNDPALFEATFALLPSEELVVVVLDGTREATSDTPFTRFHLFAITGIER